MTSTIQQVRKALSAPNMTSKRFFDRDFATVCDLAEELAKNIDVAIVQMTTATEGNAMLTRYADRLMEILLEVQE